MSEITQTEREAMLRMRDKAKPRFEIDLNETAWMLGYQCGFSDGAKFGKEQAERENAELLLNLIGMPIVVRVQESSYLVRPCADRWEVWRNYGVAGESIICSAPTLLTALRQLKERKNKNERH